MIKKTAILIALLCSMSNLSYADYTNDLSTLFLENKAVICGINIRSFNSKDTNQNGFIDAGEENGTFINAIDRLDELKDLGINTIHLLPVTPTGMLKALGTAGSLYAISDFENINEQMIDQNSNLSPKEQVKKFVDECHKRNIRVIFDLPSCGSYDLFLKHPELFVKDEKQLSIVPSDWTDVRLFNTGTKYNLNVDVLNAHFKFIDMVISLGGDGIRADVATIKPGDFWEVLISHAKDKDPQFMFLAEASDSWREPPSVYSEFTPYNMLLKAGFDGYYGSFFNLKEWNGEDLINHIKFNDKLLKSYKNPKSAILSFTTHDELSPVILHGEDYSVLIAWLEAVLPYNPYIIDGFQTGDDYFYPLANTKAEHSFTDDDYYFVHRGKLDIFNLSRKPGGNSQKIYENLKQAYQFRNENIELITKGNFIPLKVKNKNLFAFSISDKNNKIIVLGNLDFENGNNKVKIKDNKSNKHYKFEIIHGNDNIKINKKHIETSLEPGEIKVLKFSKEAKVSKEVKG